MTEYVSRVKKNLQRKDEDMFSNNDGQRVMGLVEALMKEVQKLKDDVRVLRREQKQLNEFISVSHKIHHDQITEINNHFTKLQSNRSSLQDQVADLLSYNRDTKTVVFTKVQINKLEDLLRSSKLDSYTLPEEYLSLPSFEEWCENYVGEEDEQHNVSESTMDSGEKEDVESKEPTPESYVPEKPAELETYAVCIVFLYTFFTIF